MSTAQPPRLVLAVRIVVDQCAQPGLPCPPLPTMGRGLGPMTEALQLSQCPLTACSAVEVLALRPAPCRADQMRQAGLPCLHRTGHHPEPLEDPIAVPRGFIDVVARGLPRWLSNHHIVWIDGLRHAVEDLLDGPQADGDPEYRGAKGLHHASAVPVRPNQLAHERTEPWSIAHRMLGRHLALWASGRSPHTSLDAISRASRPSPSEAARSLDAYGTPWSLQTWGGRLYTARAAPRGRSWGVKAPGDGLDDPRSRLLSGVWWQSFAGAAFCRANPTTAAGGKS